MEQWIKIDISKINNLENINFLYNLGLLSIYFNDYKNEFTFEYVEKPDIEDNHIDIIDDFLYLNIETDITYKKYHLNIFFDLYEIIVNRIRHEKLKVIEEL